MTNDRPTYHNLSICKKQTERDADVALHCCRFSAINNMLSSFSVAVFSYIYDMQNVKNFYEHSQPGLSLSSSAT